MFRSPLIQFDIRDERKIIEHWPEILEAIKLSSEVLYEKIQHKAPGTLTLRERKSVYRYLLRGKYRATPFGKWAGVGVAKWIQTGRKTEFGEEIKLRTTPIQVKENLKSSNQYWLNPSLEPWGDGWKFWNFDFLNQQWRYSKAADSPLIRELRQLSYSGKPILKHILFQTLSNLLYSEREEVWRSLIDQQLLVTDHGPKIQSTARSVDHFIANRPAISTDQREKLNTFFSEIGSLAFAQPTSYLKLLIERFEEEFDDRFVPMNMLWKVVPHLTNKKQETKKTSFSEGAIKETLSKSSKTNLRELDINTGNSNKVSHTQALFRIIENGQILIDNLVFNRPYVYGGRFTLQPELFDYFMSFPGLSQDVVYADVILSEGTKANHISSHRSITPIRINCFSGSKDPNELNTFETYIGIQHGKFILVAPKWGKQVLPLFQHPLNPLFITHPLCRILWEVAHQDFFRPIYYSEPQFVSAEYLPQLEWGDIILQPRQWSVRWQDTFKKEGDFMDHLAAKGIPSHVLVGYQDQELALDLNIKEDRAILLEELQRDVPTHIQEWLWHKKVSKTISSSYYPQFLYGQTNQKFELPQIAPEALNYISDRARNWFYVRIILSPDYQETILWEQLIRFFDGLNQEGIGPYYFIYYRLINAEIRVRCRISNPNQREKAITLLHFIQVNIPDIDHVKNSMYYPEYAKYSMSAMHISEEIFYEESKIILQVNPKSIGEKISMAVGIGSIYLNNENQVEFWIDLLRALSGGIISHQPTNQHLTQFHRSTSKEWRKYYETLVRSHPWNKTKEKKSTLISNHLHMLINRIFWDQALEMEPEIYALLESIARKIKYGRAKAGKV
ncbi:lantibiotic dehydratase [Algoriphagus halophytocola]|uniref:Lantibiotic dehydratase n=1 Tax=Algoriphagus halophytocola TaxID=2991499 RepID=A0ABY6MGQ8_9BACT|nr:lantibiotic dehydratase [Algoriphagus sp. TR-M5]UZD22985.1 lantibiotic dehydratase [Algoriphagus sp. TR-M5]